MKKIVYIIVSVAMLLLAVPSVVAQVDGALTRSGEVSVYDDTRADFLTVAGKLSRYPKLSKAGESLKYAPIVSTDSVPEAYITAESARVYGNILFNGWLENVTAKGFEVSTNADFPATATVQYPVVSVTNQYVECDQPCTVNVFDLVIGQLQSSITYYVRAYATNEIGTSYGQVLTFTTLMAVDAATLPYFTDFSEDDDKENWILNNGNCTNYWMMGTDPHTQNPALFITTNGETPGYNEVKPVTVMAERYLKMDASDSLTINLDVRMYGESSYDYIKVFLAPKSMVFSAIDTNITPYSGYSYSQYALRFPNGDYSYLTNNDGLRYLHLSCLIDNPLNAGDTAKLVFLWCNDRSVLHEPPAIISSVEVIPLKIKTDSVTDITYNAASVYSIMTTTLTGNLQRGLCYSKHPGVTVGGENCINVVLDQISGSYPYILTDLVPNTKYYVCAYALSDNGVFSYGKELSFQTEPKNLVAELPYKTNFSDGYDWLVEHTISTTQNYWNFGLLTDYSDSAMYVTYNDGTQAQYYMNATTNICAEHLLRMPQTDSVHVTFYVNCGGEGGFDWMKVLLVPVNEDITTDHYAFDYNTNAMDFSNYLSQTGYQTGPYKLNLTNGTLRIAANLKNPTLQVGDTAKLVFLWHTDGGSGTQPGPIITDLYVSVLDVDVYTDSVSDITDNGANVNGHVHNPNNEVISKVGVCYGKHINPTFEDNFVESTNINADNTFMLLISNLDYNTTYYVRTFMKVDNEVFFGNQIEFMTGMAVIPDELPYVTDFSDRQQWWMNSGDSKNYWKTGKLTDDGDSMLFITNDLLYLDTCGYDITQYTFVTAEKYLKMPDNQNPIELSFDVNVGGESTYDYMMVYLCPKDQEFTPNSTGSVNPVTTNAFDFHHYKTVNNNNGTLPRYYFNLTNKNTVHINDLVNNPVPGDTAKLVFLWRTDGSGGTQPGPVISNLSVAEYVIDKVLPYSTDFSSENEEWILNSGTSKNYFMTGVPSGTTQSALFVTNDGETCSYLPNGDGVQSFTMAETYFSFPENDSLLLEFDAKAGGESCCDFLMAFVSKWDVEYDYSNVENATSDNMGAVPFIGYSSEMSSSNTYRIQFTNGTDLHHFSVKVKNPVQNGLGKLVFVWRNDGSGGSAPFDVMVTNVSLTEVEPDRSCPGTPTVKDHEGNVYHTVLIGEQCWTRENMRCTTSPNNRNYLQDGGNNAISSYLPYYYIQTSNNIPSVDRGVYYNWTAAMDTSFVSTSASHVIFTGYRRGICPKGWHVPSDAEWVALRDFLKTESQYVCGDNNSFIAKALAIDSNYWYTANGSCRPGYQPTVSNNATGFSAVPAGYRWNNAWSEEGASCYFWTSTSNSDLRAQSNYLEFSSEIEQSYDDHKGSAISVRCVKDVEEPQPSFSCGTDKMVVPDGHSYETVELGSQCWTKTNLREPAGINHSSDMAHSSTDAYYYIRPNVDDSLYGYYYNWEAAKIACPDGWHLPSDAEWNVMESTLTDADVYPTGQRGDHAGKMAVGDEWRASSVEGSPGHKTDVNRNQSEFSARGTDRIYYGSLETGGTDAWFYTSTQRMGSFYSYYTEPVCHRLIASYTSVQRITLAANTGMSVRCVRDLEISSETCPTVGDVQQNGDDFSASVTVPDNVTIVGQYYTVYAPGISTNNGVIAAELSEAGATLSNGTITATLDLSQYAGRTVAVNAHVIAVGCDEQMAVIDGTPINVTMPLPDVCPAFVSGTEKASLDENGYFYIEVSVSPENMSIVYWNNVTTTFMVSYLDGNNDSHTEYIQGSFSQMSQYGGDDQFYAYPSYNIGCSNFSVEASMSYNNCNVEPIIIPVTLCPAFGPEGSLEVLENPYSENYIIRIPVVNSENYEPSNECILYYPDQSQQTGYYENGYVYFDYPAEYAETPMTLNFTIYSGMCTSQYHVEDFIPEVTTTFVCGISIIKDIDQNVYNTVQIGKQCWMKENLRTLTTPLGDNITEWYAPNYDYNNNVLTYGLLYTWDAMMNGEQSSTTNPSDVQGICPDGWHIPSLSEWLELIDTATNMATCGNAIVLADNIEGWNYSSYYCSPGYDLSQNNASGFSARAAGYFENGSIDGFGINGNYWTSTEVSNNPNNAYRIRILNWAVNLSTEDTDDGGRSKTNGHAVRCVMDSEEEEEAFSCGDNIQDIDGNTYATVEIGNQCWMKENLRTTKDPDGNDLVDNTYNYPLYNYPGGSSDNVTTYGLLYSWDVMMNGENSSEENPSDVQGICPEGWHVPSLAEWDVLIASAGLMDDCGAARALADNMGWNTSGIECTPGFNLEQNNATGFSALPAGTSYNPDDLGNTTQFWTATGVSGYNHAFNLNMNYAENQIETYGSDKYNSFSVRCVKDADQPAQSFSCGDNLIDGNNSYATIQLGDYCWMKENLRTEVTSGHSTNSIYTSESIAYSYYPNGNESNVANYGYLYNWTAARAGMNSSEGVQGICPNGWHLPTEAEANDLKLRVSDLTSPTANNFFGGQYAGLFKIGDGGDPFQNFSTDAWLWVTAYYNGDYNAILAIGPNSSNNVMKNSRRDIGAAIRCVMNTDDGNTTETCPSLGVSQEAHSNTAQYVYSPVIDFDADKINNDYCGYAVFAGGSNVLIVRKNQYPDLVNTSFIEENGSYNLWVTIDFELIATAAQGHNVQVSSGDQVSIMPLINLNLNHCAEGETYGSTVILTMP